VSEPLYGGVGHASVRRLLRLLATAGAALVLVVIVSSAYLRLSQAGLSCADWPACYGDMTHVAEITTAQYGARLAHRFAASAVGAVLLALLVLAMRQRPRLRPQALLAGAGLLVAAGLATLGAVTSESTRAIPLPAVTLANLLGGFALLAVSWWLRETVSLRSASTTAMSATMAKAAARRARPSRALRTLGVLTLATVIGQVTLGALVSAKFAALACPAFPLCGADAATGSLLATLNPFTALDVDASGSIVRPVALASLHWAHRIGAHAVLVLAAILAVALVRNGMRDGYIVALLVVAAVALGASSVLTGVPLPLVLAHNVAAALLLAALVTINHRIRAPAA
jgi:heme a synthase